MHGSEGLFTGTQGPVLPPPGAPSEGTLRWLLPGLLEAWETECVREVGDSKPQITLRCDRNSEHTRRGLPVCRVLRTHTTTEHPRPFKVCGFASSRCRHLSTCLVAQNHTCVLPHSSGAQNRISSGCGLTELTLRCWQSCCPEGSRGEPTFLPFPPS